MCVLNASRLHEDSMFFCFGTSCRRLALSVYSLGHGVRHLLTLFLVAAGWQYERCHASSGVGVPTVAHLYDQVHVATQEVTVHRHVLGAVGQHELTTAAWIHG